MNQNNAAVPWKWVAISLASICGALILLWASDMITRGNTVQAQTAANAAEIAALKAGFASMNASIVVRLDRIENKVDALEMRRR